MGAAAAVCRLIHRRFPKAGDGELDMCGPHRREDRALRITGSDRSIIRNDRRNLAPALSPGIAISQPDKARRRADIARRRMRRAHLFALTASSSRWTSVSSGAAGWRTRRLSMAWRPSRRPAGNSWMPPFRAVVTIEIGSDKGDGAQRSLVVIKSSCGMSRIGRAPRNRPHHAGSFCNMRTSRLALSLKRRGEK